MARNHRTRGTCTFPDCGKPHFAKGWCQGHYAQVARGHTMHPLYQPAKGRVCEVDGCDRPQYAKGVCQTHRRQQREGRTDLRPIRPRGGRTCTREGCDKPHKARGLCATHLSEQYRRDAGILPWAARKKPPQPKPEKPRPKLPKDWLKPLASRKSTSITPTIVGTDIGPVTPLDPTVTSRMIDILRRRDAMDLADMLGLNTHARKAA